VLFERHPNKRRAFLTIPASRARDLLKIKAYIAEKMAEGIAGVRLKRRNRNFELEIARPAGAPQQRNYGACEQRDHTQAGRCEIELHGHKTGL
jgi:hypothetical protein